MPLRSLAWSALVNCLPEKLQRLAAHDALTVQHRGFQNLPLAFACTLGLVLPGRACSKLSEHQWDVVQDALSPPARLLVLTDSSWP